MSLLRRKIGFAAGAGARMRMRARQKASQAVPLAKNAGAVAKHGAGEAAVRARPHVHRARRWAAPRIERTGKAVQEKVAPQVSAMMTKAARRMDPDPKAQRRSRFTRGITLLMAAASATVAIVLLRRHAPETGDGGTSEADPEHGTGEQAASADDAAKIKVNGQVSAS